MQELHRYLVYLFVHNSVKPAWTSALSRWHTLQASKDLLDRVSGKGNPTEIAFEPAFTFEDQDHPGIQQWGVHAAFACSHGVWYYKPVLLSALFWELIQAKFAEDVPMVQVKAMMLQKQLSIAG